MIEERFDRLHDLQNKCLNEVRLIYSYEINKSKGISHVAHYAASIITRASSLINSFELLYKHGIYSTALSLIRLQIDNCLRLYAISLCNPVLLLTEVEKGTSIRDIKDRDGKKMNDGYLITKLENILPNFKSLYDETCGFVHFSFEHLKLNNRKYEENGIIEVETLIGSEFEISDADKVKYLNYMITSTYNLFRLIYSYRYDSQNE